MTDREYIAARLRGKRAERDWTQRQAAEAIGVCLNTVHRWETGTVEIPVSGIIAAARVYECPVNDLLPPPPVVAESGVNATPTI